MDQTCTKWCTLPAQFISDNSEIPPDITFKFKDSSSDDDAVTAHKMLLAMVSKVFRNMFYVHNTADKSANQVVIEDATKPAFQIMIDAIYNAKPIKESLKGKSLHDIFAVLYVVTKYELHDLVLEVKDFLSSFPITEDTVIEVATNAMEYLATFEACAQEVLFACAKFLKPKFPDANSLLRFVAKNNDRYATVHKLMIVMDGMIPTVCSNCNNEPCLDKTEVQASQFRKNLKVAYNPASSMWVRDLMYFYADVLDIVNDKKVELKATSSAREVSKERSSVVVYNVESVKGKLNFLFNCK